MSQENPGTSRSSNPEEQNPQKLTQSKLRIRQSVLHFVLRRFRNAKKKIIPKSMRNRQDRHKDRQPPEKYKWTDKRDLLINCIGFSVGIGNIWRFPFLAFQNGGGAFLIPYLILTCLISIPMYYMELTIGQLSGLNPVNVWSMCPFFQGLGVTIVLSTMLVQVYYNVVMSYALFYVLQSFRKRLPWSECAEWWGADNATCYETKNAFGFCDPMQDNDQNSTFCRNGTQPAADQFWRRYVLDLSSGLEELGTVKWDLAVVLLATWITIVCLVIERHHIQFNAKFKIVYFTAFFPFVILAIHFFYSLTLKGMQKGLLELFVPHWMSLLNARVWSEGIQASMYSVGLGMGGLIVFGSKNNLKTNLSNCSIVACLVDAFGSIFAASVTFMVVGFLSDLIHLNFSETTLSGQGLVFVTFPNAMLEMGIPHVWNFAFFTMLFILAVDSSIAMSETIAIGIGVYLGNFYAEAKRIIVFMALFMYLMGLILVTNGGPFILNILDHYIGGHALMGTVMFEAIAFGWGYGVKQASKDMENIQGFKPSLYTKICWMIFSPVILMVLFFYLLWSNELQPQYDIPYPPFADFLGWALTAMVLLPVPIFMVIALFRNRKNLSNAFKPGNIWESAIERHNDQA